MSATEFYAWFISSPTEAEVMAWVHGAERQRMAEEQRALIAAWRQKHDAHTISDAGAWALISMGRSVGRPA